MPKINNPQNFNGETLISKEALGLDASDVLVTAGKVDSEFLPQLQLKGEDVSDMGQKINFIGNCNVVKNADGSITIRIGDNLNSSTFNTQDGQTVGTATYADNSSTYPATRITSAAGSKSAWLKDSNDIVTISTSGKIHLDDLERTKFNLTVTTAAGTTNYVFGAITANGYYTNGAAVTSTAPATATAAYLQVTNLTAETKSAEGATGYCCNIAIKINLTTLATVEGAVSLTISSEGTAGAANYSKDIAYYIVDTTTKPTVSNVKALLPAEPTTQTWAGITSVKSATFTYKATVDNLNVPATDVAGGASIKIDNTANYAADQSKIAQTVYEGEISKTANLSTTATKYTTSLTDSITFTAWNINGSTSATGSLYESDGTTLVNGLDVYAGTPDASITTNRKTADGTAAYTNTAAPASGDLMVYHGALQYPQAFIDNTYYANDEYVAPTGTGDKVAVFWFSASGTEPGGTLIINGTNLTSANVKSVLLGNDFDNLLDITSTAGIGTSPTETATKLTYVYEFQTQADHISKDSGCWVKITFSGTGPTITSIVRG